MKLLYLSFAAAAIVCGGVTAHADNKVNMVIAGADGMSAIAVDNITNIAFDGNVMIVNAADGVRQVDVTQLTNITFDFSTSVSDRVAFEKDDVSLLFDSGVLTVNCTDGTPVSVVVYAIGGNLVKTLYATGSVTADLTELPKGVYVVIANGKTVKFVR